MRQPQGVSSPAPSTAKQSCSVAPKSTISIAARCRFQGSVARGPAPMRLCFGKGGRGEIGISTDIWIHEWGMNNSHHHDRPEHYGKILFLQRCQGFHEGSDGL
jgi:hypothetical protein